MSHNKQLHRNGMTQLKHLAQNHWPHVSLFFSPSSQTCALERVEENWFRSISLYPWPWNSESLCSSELSDEESGKASFVLDALIGWDNSEEESRDVPGVESSLSLPMDVSLNFLACLCVPENGCPFLFFLYRFLVFFPVIFESNRYCKRKDFTISLSSRLKHAVKFYPMSPNHDICVM